METGPDRLVHKGQDHHVTESNLEAAITVKGMKAREMVSDGIL